MLRVFVEKQSVVTTPNLRVPGLLIFVSVTICRLSCRWQTSFAQVGTDYKIIHKEFVKLAKNPSMVCPGESIVFYRRSFNVWRSHRDQTRRQVSPLSRWEVRITV